MKGGLQGNQPTSADAKASAHSAVDDLAEAIGDAFDAAETPGGGFSLSDVGIANRLLAGPLSDPVWLLELPALAPYKAVIEAAQSYVRADHFNSDGGDDHDWFITASAALDDAVAALSEQGEPDGR